MSCVCTEGVCVCVGGGGGREEIAICVQRGCVCGWGGVGEEIAMCVHRGSPVRVMMHAFNTMLHAAT